MGNTWLDLHLLGIQVVALLHERRWSLDSFELVPYRGGLSKHIPAKDGKLGFVDAEESIFLWAKQMGYAGEKLSKPSRIDGELEIFSYLNGDVSHYKVVNEGHGALNAISEKILLEFLKGDSEREK